MRITISTRVAESIADCCFPNEPLYDERTNTFEILEHENFNNKEDIIQTIVNADCLRHSEG